MIERLRSMDRSAVIKLTLSVFLSIALTVSLFYLTLELPHLLDKYLHKYFPDLFWEPELRKILLNSVRPLGYTMLIIIIILIIIGYIFDRGIISVAGSIALYIPTFGYFAFAMFFLAGIGILRVIWLPFIEYSPKVLELGNVVIMPYIILRKYCYWRISYGISTSTAIIFIFLGLFIFSMGVTTWLYGKFKGCKIIDFWIYRYIRHPQYLGYILWSYGLLVLIYFMPHVRGAFITLPSYPWLISALTIIGVALYEEEKMRRVYGEEYIIYSRKTSFMLPLPRRIAELLKMPLCFFDEKHDIKVRIVIVLVFYLIILTIISYVINILLPPY
ncbi:MAG TPA: hypothetical protein ENF47_02700 [Thermoprotei archaeon]|nr:hypothetical protein [Thermoprotei archaeon]